MFAGPSNADDAAGAAGLGDDGAGGGVGVRFAVLAGGFGAGGGDDAGLALASRIVVVEDVGAGGRGDDETGAGAVTGRD